MEKYTNKKGFSLVELLIAMAIIAILIAIAAYGIAIVQRNARNTRRRKAVEDVVLTIGDIISNTQGAAPEANENGFTKASSGTQIEMKAQNQFGGEVTAIVPEQTSTSQGVPRLGGFNTLEDISYSMDACSGSDANTEETDPNTIHICYDPGTGSGTNGAVGTRIEGATGGFQLSFQ